MDNLEARVKKVIAEKLGVDEATIKNEASFIDDLGADSPYLRPLVYKDMNCVTVKKELQEQSQSVFDFIMQFATDNKLIVVDCAKFKNQIALRI